MKKLKKYTDFLLEKNNMRDEESFQSFFDTVMKLSNDEIMELKDEIEKMSDESVNESFSSLKRKFSKWFDDKLFSFLINRKKDFYMNIVDNLNLFDLENLDDVMENFNINTIDGLYLAGGMDDAEDTGAGWRTEVEEEFEFNNPGKYSKEVDEIKVGDKMIMPAYVVDGIFLDKVLNDTKNTLKLYDTPVLFNPVRKEVDRNKDDSFERNVKDMKAPGFNPEENEEPYEFFQKTFTGSIEPDDEHLLRIATATFLGYNTEAGAGTYGELELLSMIRKPLFVWLTGDYNNDMGKFKLWNIPHISKIARNKEEMEILVKSIKNYSK